MTLKIVSPKIHQGAFLSMMQVLRDSGKRTAGWLLSRSAPRYRYSNCVFILAHMRCGSTALSNILCSRADVSGYGEAHIRYDGQGALGRLALNQMRRGGFRSQAPLLFDKILHSRHDKAAPPAFFEARAIFVVRRPGDAIRSIVKLFASLGRDEYATDVQAAAYYVERLAALALMWERFPKQRRVGVTHESLLHDPDGELARMSARLSFSPPLENRYVSLAASRRGGGGDPLVSGQHDRIEPALARLEHVDTEVDVPLAVLAELSARYQHMVALFAADRT